MGFGRKKATLLRGCMGLAVPMIVQDLLQRFKVVGAPFIAPYDEIELIWGGYDDERTFRVHQNFGVRCIKPIVFAPEVIHCEGLARRLELLERQPHGGFAQKSICEVHGFCQGFIVRNALVHDGLVKR